MATSMKEIREKNIQVGRLLDEMREVLAARRLTTPGKPSVALPLDQVFSYTDGDGETRAVIPIEQVIYLVDGILRMHTR